MLINKFLPRKNTSLGFTLIELLVVMSIMVIIGVVVFVNFGGFQKDQALEKQALDIQNFFRTAQTNATARVVCQTPTQGIKPGADWVVEIIASKVILKCRNRTNPGVPASPTYETSTSSYTDSYKEYDIKDGVRITDISSPSCIIGQPLSVIYAALYGTVTFSNDSVLAPSGCHRTSKEVTITLTNDRTGSTKKLKIDSGGAINVF